MAALGAFILVLVSAAVAALVIPIVAAALFGGGASWAIGNTEAGKQRVIAALVGSGIMLLAVTIANQIGTLSVSGGG